MNDENEFVQKVRFEVEDTELSASLDRFQAALGRAGETANREIDESLTKAASSANEVAKETANIGKEASSAAKETQKISSASREAKKQTDALDGAFSKLKGTISAAVAAYAGFQGLSKLVGFGKQTVELFKVQDRAERALKFQMQRNGTDARFGELQRFAANLQKNSMYGDEALLNAASVWSNKIKDVDNNKRMMQLVADYTARTTNGAEVGADQLKSYTMTLMSALSGRGTMTLEQQGFDTTAIKELQKFRQKGGTVTETMQVEALEKTLASVKGFAREMANTDAGKIAQLQNEIGDVKEEIGRELLPVFAELAREVKANIPSIRKLFEGFASVLKSLVKTLSENIGTISAFADGLASLLQLFSVAPIKTMAFAGALKYAVPMLDAATKGSMAFGGALGGLGKNWQNLLKAGLFTATIWGLQQIFKLGNAIKQAWKEHERQNAIEGASEVKKQVESGTYFADLLRTYRRDFQALGTQPVEMDGLQRMAVNEKGDFIDSEGKPIDFATLGIPLAARELQRKYNVARYYDENKDAAKKYAQKQLNDAYMMKGADLGADGYGNGTAPEVNFTPVDMEAEIQKAMQAAAKSAKGDTNITNIDYTNNITTDSDMMAKLIKENLRTLLQSQLTFKTRAEGVKALAL